MTVPRLLLCTDLDRTLLPNGPQPESPAARRAFAALVAQPQVLLAYVSGRDSQRVKDAMAEYQLPQPDFVISDVGTSLYDLRRGNWLLEPLWHQFIASDWQGQSWQQLHLLLKDSPELRLQLEDQQSDYKLSYFVPLTSDQPQLDRQIRQALQDAGIAANLTWSVDEPAGVGLLDILPHRAGKLPAIEFLAQLLQLPHDRLLFAGDSGNDLPVLCSSIPAVLVANASVEVREQALAGAMRTGQRQRLYLAEGKSFGLNGNYSAGILEGVEHYHPELVTFFSSELQTQARHD